MANKPKRPSEQGRQRAGRTTTRSDVRRAIRRAKALTPEEDKVVRVRHGVGGDHDLVLEQKGQEFEETRAFLEMMELRALMRTGRLDLAEVRPEVKAKIIDALKGS